MAHWFHRNPIKPTEATKFDLKGVCTNDNCTKVCRELALRRDQLLAHFRNAGLPLADVEKDFNDYCGLFAGFHQSFLNESAQQNPAPQGDNPSTTQPHETDAKKEESKLIPLIRTKWGHSMLVGMGTELSDSRYELYNMCQNMGFWLMKHAAWVAGKDEVYDSEAKECLSCMRRAAGVFAFVSEKAGQLSGATELEGSDFDPNVMKAYELQATAEAQEIIVARAIEMKHNHLLISSLATNTAGIFQKADQHLQKFKEEIFGRWRRYLQLKHHLYLSYGYAFLGESLLKEDKCGEGVRACKEGVSEFRIACDFAAKYATATGPGTRIKPESHLFFRRVGELLKRHLEKAERENGFIYHQKVPDDVPLLEAEANYGLAKAEPFTLPKPAAVWTPGLYAAFNLSKADMPDFSKVKKSSKKLDAVQEEKIYQTEKDPSNSSGCSVM